MSGPSPRRPSPDELLERLTLEEHRQSRGQLKIFLGYASGVGKSTRMFDEGRRRAARGEDVVVAALQDARSSPPHGLESLATPDGAIDIPALLLRRPAVALVDGLAHSNPPASAHPHRWQDVEALLAAGISVLSSINLHYIAERQPEVEAIRGRKASCSVPESFIRSASEIEVVDAPAEYCLNHPANRRLSTSARAHLAAQLSALREICLLLAAEVVDKQLEDALRRHGGSLYGARERILVGVTPRSNAALMIHRARRQADRFHGELYVVAVRQPGLSPSDQAILDANLQTAREARAHVEILDAADHVSALLRFSSEHAITQIFVGHSRRAGLRQRFQLNPVERLILESDGIDIRVFPQARPTP